MEEAQVRWKSRRGMKELDVMLGRYLDERWPHASATERTAYVALLDLQDPELWDLLLARTQAGSETKSDVVARIRTLSGV